MNKKDLELAELVEEMKRFIYHANKFMQSDDYKKSYTPSRLRGDIKHRSFVVSKMLAEYRKL